MYDVGCAGRITAFSETNDNRYELILKEFVIQSKRKKSHDGFRSADVLWDEFENDFEITNPEIGRKTDFESLLGLLNKI